MPADAGLEELPSVRLTPDELRDAAMGRFVRPMAGVTGLPAERPIRLLDEAGRIAGIGTLDGRRIAPAKMLGVRAAEMAGRAADGGAADTAADDMPGREPRPIRAGDG